MNNEKLILEALGFLLVTNHPISKEATQKRFEIVGKIDKILNPSQDVPYEDSLNEPLMYSDKELNKKVAKSSQEEKE